MISILLFGLKILIYGLLFLLAIGAYLAIPLVGKVVVLVINCFLTDPLPFIDEIIMFLGIGKHIDTGMKMVDFIRAHKILSIIGFIMIIILVKALLF